MADRELCSLMDRLDDGVKLEVVFADAALSAGRGEVGCGGCEEADRTHPMLLHGVRMRGGVVKVQIQKVEELGPCG